MDFQICNYIKQHLFNIPLQFKGFSPETLSYFSLSSLLENSSTNSKP
ncbi:unnamed protein product [Paramecium octaurelia]|uniref:Uncharacterized protein n=1 Tax=Paramecium octaurelia TaxID=43137 RepID=A0A8S1TYS3_PAROT|nr:unnamed protein product [Paramecium octaurelia]CAD8158015.1 unnamed protein product [Paramecium octaurelia]